VHWMRPPLTMRGILAPLLKVEEKLDGNSQGAAWPLKMVLSI
jgi:hypothetical protein